MRVRAILLSLLMLSSIIAIPLAGVGAAQQGQGPPDNAGGGPPAYAGPPDHAAVNSVAVKGPGANAPGGPPDHANLGVSASSHGSDMSAEIRLREDGSIEALILDDDRNHDGRQVAVDASAVESGVGSIPDTIYGIHESGDQWTSETTVENGSLLFDVPHFSTNTISFEGSYSLNATAAEDGDSYSYQLSSGDVDNLNLNLTGVSRTNSESTTQRVSNGDSIPIEVSGTEATEVQITMEGVADSNGWSTQTEMPTNRRKLGVTEANGLVYAIGGAGDLATAERYDPAADSWTALSAMPTGRTNPAVASVNGKVYAIGGGVGSGSGSWTGVVEMYDPSTGSWSTKASMPTSRKHASAAAVNGDIYVIGGYNGGDAGSTVERYDPDTDSWSTDTSVPISLQNTGIAVVDGNIYLIGGVNNGNHQNTLYKFDTSAGSWTQLSSMSTKRRWVAGGSFSGGVYAIGGHDGSSDLASVERYDIDTDSWSTVDSMSASRAKLGVASTTSNMYAIGGEGGSSDLGLTEEYSQAITDPSVVLGGTNVSYSGVLTSNDTQIGTATVDPGALSADISATTTGGMDVSLAWTEETLSQDPTIEINGQSVGYTGTLAAGETTSVDTSGVSINSSDVSLNVSVSSGVYPVGAVGFEWSHTAEDQQDVEFTSETFVERYNVSHTYSTNTTDARFRIPLSSDRVVAIDSLTYYKNGTEAAADWSWDGSTNEIVVDLGSVTAGAEHRVTTEARKIQVPSGAISVTDPTLEGTTLDSQIRIEDDAGADPVEIEVGGTVDGDLMHYLSESDWTADDRARFEADGSQTLVLPAAPNDALGRITTAPISAEVSSGDAVLTLDNLDEPRFSVDPGSSSGDSITIGYVDATSGEDYVLRDPETDDTVGPQTANSPVYFDIGDSATTWVVELFDGSSGGDGGAAVSVSSSGSGPLSIITLFAALGLSLVGSLILGRRFGVGSPRLLLVIGLVIGGVGIEAVTSESVIAGIVAGVVGTIDAVITGILGGFAESGAGSIVIGLLLFVVIYLVRSRFDIPTWLTIVSGGLTAIWTVDSISGGQLTGSLDDLGPLLWLLLIGGGGLLLWRALRPTIVQIGPGGN